MTELEKQTFDKVYALIEKNKQIEEMAMSICENTDISCYETGIQIAEHLINEKGYRKASEVAREIIGILKSAGIDEWRYPVIAELKKKYTEEGK